MTDPLTRPDKRYSSLGLSGTTARRRAPFTEKAGAIGVVGRTTIDLIPSAVISIARAHRTLTDLVLSIRPVGAVISVAHTSNRQGRTTLGFQPIATMRFTRVGRQYAFQGSNTLEFGTFGNVHIRHRRAQIGSNSITMVPQATAVYTPAPLRNHHLLARVTTRLIPQATITRTQNGLAFSLDSGSTLELKVAGRVAVVRQTTYRTSGRITVTLQPSATMVKGSGPPVDYAIQARTTLALLPRATLGYNVGAFERFEIMARSITVLTPMARITLRRAPTVTPLGDFRRGERRFIRVERRR